MMNLNLRLLMKIHEGANDTYREDDEIVSHIAILRSWVDREDPEKLAYVYEWFDNRFYDRLYTIDKFMKISKELIDLSVEETYFSINSFWQRNKKTEDIRHLNAFALDFDYYKIKKYANLTPEEMYKTHIQDKLPFEPTAVVDSGRGIYVIYAFKHCSIKCLKLYRSVYKQFLLDFKILGMDAKATNVTQVIRMPGSYNVKADKEVAIIEFHDTNYQLTDFGKLLPYSLEETREHMKEFRKDMGKLMDEKVKNKCFHPSEEQRKKCRWFLEDLKTLIILKNNEKTRKGYREFLIYIALDRMLRTGFTKAKAIEKAKKINNLFMVPLLDSEVENRCMPKKIYFKEHSIQKIIDNLEITEDMQKSLKVLKSKKERDLHKKRRKNIHPLLNRSNKEIELLKRRVNVIEQKKSGKLNVDIARSLNVNKSTITQDLKYIKNNKQEFASVLEETIEALIASLSIEKNRRVLTHDELIGLYNFTETGITVISDP